MGFALDPLTLFSFGNICFPELLGGKVQDSFSNFTELPLLFFLCNFQKHDQLLSQDFLALFFFSTFIQSFLLFVWLCCPVLINFYSTSISFSSLWNPVLAGALLVSWRVPGT